MQTKEILLVALGAVILSNVSIVGTLMATGHYGGHQHTSETPEPQSQEAPATPAQPPPRPRLHSLWQATYLCEEKLMSLNSNHHIAHQVNSAASRYSEEEKVYRIFIDTKTASSVDAPQQSAEVTCEVSSETMTVVGYRSMKD